jgi:hypothetical protein
MLPVTICPTFEGTTSKFVWNVSKPSDVNVKVRYVIAGSIVSWISRSTVTNSNLECKPNDIQGPKIPVCDRRPEHFQGDTLTVMHVSFTRIVPDDPVGHDDLFSIL